MDNIERTFLELESLFADPEFKASLDEVKEINELLLIEPTDEADAGVIINALNAKWHSENYFAEEMYVTGDVYIGGSYGDIEYVDLGEERPANLTDYPFISYGFSLLASITELEGEPSVHQQIIMVGRIETPNRGDVGGISNDVCAIPLSSATSIEHKGLTAHKADAWLDVYMPDTKAMINQSVLEAGDESEAVMNLKNVLLPPPEKRKRDTKELQRVLDVFIGSVLAFDRHVPYLVEILGECKLFDTQKAGWHSQHVTNINTSLLTIRSPEVILNKETKQFEVSLVGTLVLPGKDNTMLIKVPLSSLRAIQSGRDILKEY